MERIGVKYECAEYSRYRDIFKTYQEKYNKDKRFLAQIMKGLQQTATYNWQKKEDSFNGGNAILSKYN